MKLVLKILALPVLFVVKVICVLGNLLTNVVSYVIGIFLSSFRIRKSVRKGALGTSQTTTWGFPIGMASQIRLLFFLSAISNFL